MEEFKKQLNEFLSLYDRPNVTVQQITPEYFPVTGSEWGDVIPASIEITLNGYSDAVTYYYNLNSTKENIIQNLWKLINVLSINKFQSIMKLSLSLLKVRRDFFNIEPVDYTFSFIPPDSAKKLTQWELISSTKEELIHKYLDPHIIPTHTNEREVLSGFYYYMIEILDELIYTFENFNLNNSNKAIFIRSSFELTYTDQSLVDFMNSLIRKEIIESTDFKLFNNVFLGKIVEKKINWLKGKEAFKYFINRLYRDGYVKPLWPKWKIASKCFLIDGQEIDETNIATQQHPNIYIQRTLNDILKNLQKVNSKV
jgi:hypothetical protein